MENCGFESRRGWIAIRAWEQISKEIGYGWKNGVSTDTSSKEAEGRDAHVVVVRGRG